MVYLPKLHVDKKTSHVQLCGSSPEAHLARMVFRVRVRVLGLGLGLRLGHSRVLARCASGLDPNFANKVVE